MMKRKKSEPTLIVSPSQRAGARTWRTLSCPRRPWSSCLTWPRPPPPRPRSVCCTAARCPAPASGSWPREPGRAPAPRGGPSLSPASPDTPANIILQTYIHYRGGKISASKSVCHVSPSSVVRSDRVTISLYLKSLTHEMAYSGLIGQNIDIWPLTGCNYYHREPF